MRDIEQSAATPRPAAAAHLKGRALLPRGFVEGLDRIPDMAFGLLLLTRQNRLGAGRHT
jgi:hypothetical protein